MRNEIFSAFIDLRFFRDGVYCFLLPAGGNDYWVTSDSPLGSPAHPQETLWICRHGSLAQILGPFLSWVGENPHSGGYHCPVWGCCELDISVLGLLWRCRPTLLLGFICLTLYCSFSQFASLLSWTISIPSPNVSCQICKQQHKSKREECGLAVY